MTRLNKILCTYCTLTTRVPRTEDTVPLVTHRVVVFFSSPGRILHYSLDRTGTAEVQIFQYERFGPAGSVVSFRTDMRERQIEKQVLSLHPPSTTWVMYGSESAASQVNPASPTDPSKLGSPPSRSRHLSGCPIGSRPTERALSVR